LNQHFLIVSALKRSLKMKGMTYKDLAKSLKLSETSVKRAFSKGTFTLKRLGEVCHALDIPLCDLMSVSQNHAKTKDQLSLRQEEALASDLRLFSYFCLLMGGMTPETIASGFRYSETESRKHVQRLESLGVLERISGDRIRLLVSKNYRCSGSGPLMKVYGQDLKKDYLLSDFSGPGEAMRLSHGRFSPESLKLISKKVDRLQMDIQQLAEVDSMGSKGDDCREIWFLNAFRPWTYSKIAELRKRDAR
jgi:predicted transcriptional regulator